MSVNTCKEIKTTFSCFYTNRVLLLLFQPHLFATNQLNGFAYGMIVLVHQSEVLVHVPDVASDECLQLYAKHRQRVAALFVVARFYLLALSLSKKTVDHGLWHFKVLHIVVELRVLRLQLLAMVLNIAQGGVDDE